MLELKNLRSNNMRLQNHYICEEVNLDEANQVQGSGIFSAGGAVAGGLTGAGVGILKYPVQQGYKELVAGDSDFNLADYGSEIVGNAAGFGAVGAGFGRFIDSAFKP